MFFAFVKELRFHSVLPFIQIFLYLELLRPQFVDKLAISLEKVFGHGCYIFYLYLMFIYHHLFHQIQSSA